MYAIVDIKGKQFKVEKNQTINVPKLNEKVGSKVEFDNVLLTNDKGKLSTKSTLKVIAEIVSHDKEDKVVVFKMKRRKGHQKKNGHKQQFTTIQIKDLKAAKKTAAKTKKTTTAKKVEKSKD
tara:strand:- start:4171 stop:4536 length:366 start_codon:yes stop_codon:yes gene_type:complete